MERGLVGTEVNADSVSGEAFPEVYHIALIGERYGLAVFAGFGGASHEIVKRGVDFVHPALAVAGLYGLGVDFCYDTDNSGNVAGFWLCA